MIIRRLQERDAQAVSALIMTTIRVSNAKDYPAEAVETFAAAETPEHILERAAWTHFYVAEDGGRIIGCGAIGPYWGKTDESSLFTIFVHPDCQGRGIGRQIVETLERDAFALRAGRIEIPASVTGLPFYQKMGYTFKPGSSAQPDEEGLYRLEKRKAPAALIEVTAAEEKRRVARSILEALPDWFGVPESRERYIRDSADWLFFACYDENRPLGFLCLKETGDATVELAVMGVLMPWHHQGIGRALFRAAKERAEAMGYAFMQVKTVQEGRYPDYDDTNRFYRSLGFRELEVFPTLWDEANPCQVYVMALRQPQAALSLLLGRRSYRGKYRPDRIPREHLTMIMEAGLAAPSGCNKQTTSLIAVDEPDTLARLRAVIQPPVGETAPAIICVLTQRINAYRDRCFAVQDYAAAIENMLLAIEALGYRSCWYEGHITDTDRIGDQMARVLGVPEGYELVCFLPVGIAEEAPKAPKKKPFSDRAWFNGFQSPVSQ